MRPYLGRRLADLTGGRVNVRFLTAGDFGLILGEQALLAAGREPLPFLGDRVLARQLAEAANRLLRAGRRHARLLYRSAPHIAGDPPGDGGPGQARCEGEKLNALAGLYQRHEQDRARFYAPDDALLSCQPGPSRHIRAARIWRLGCN